MSKPNKTSIPADYQLNSKYILLEPETQSKDSKSNVGIGTIVMVGETNFDSYSGLDDEDGDGWKKLLDDDKKSNKCSIGDTIVYDRESFGMKIIEFYKAYVLVLKDEIIMKKSGK